MSRRIPLWSLVAILGALSIGLLVEPVPAQQTFQGENPSRCISQGVSSAAINTASSGNVEVVALAAGETIHVCGFSLNADTAVGVQFITGTGTACATGETDLTGVYDLLDASDIVVPNAGATQFTGASASALCIELSGAVQVNGHVTYVQY